MFLIDVVYFSFRTLFYIQAGFVIHHNDSSVIGLSFRIQCHCRLIWSAMKTKKLRQTAIHLARGTAIDTSTI